MKIRSYGAPSCLPVGRDPAYPTLAGRVTVRPRSRKGDHPSPTGPQTEKLPSYHSARYLLNPNTSCMSYSPFG
jgi:hypothetical protein